MVIHANLNKAIFYTPEERRQLKEKRKAQVRQDSIEWDKDSCKTEALENHINRSLFPDD